MEDGMPHLAANVFKFLIISILLMICVDVTVRVVDMGVTYSRVEGVMGLMRTEIAKNNYLPEEEQRVFTTELQDIAKKSMTFAYDSSYDGSSAGWRGQSVHIKINPDATSAINADNLNSPGDYGSLKNLNIRMYICMRAITIHKSMADWRQIASVVPVTFRDTVPCLRYIKGS